MDKKGSIKRKNIYTLVVLLISLFLIYSLFFPDNSGILGLFVYKQCKYLFGNISFFIPPLLLLLAWELFRSEKFNWINKSIISFVYLVSMSGFFGLLSESFKREDIGGVVGRMTAYIFSILLGTVGAYVLTISFVILSVVILFDVSLKNILHSFKESVSKIQKSLLGYLKKIKENISANQEKKSKEPIIHAAAISAKGKTVELKNKKENSEPKIMKLFGNKKNDNKEEVIKDKEKVQTAVKEKPVVAVSDLDKDSEGEAVSIAEYKIPLSSLLQEPVKEKLHISENELKDNAMTLQSTLKSFGVDVRVSGIHPGPVITRYEMELAPGVKVNTITSLSNDISLAMKSPSVRILAPIPGKSAVGIELPNEKAAAVVFRDMVESNEFNESKSKLSFALGKTVSGKTKVADLGAMPHLLVAGATGSGKSVCINTLIMSILYKARPNEVKFILVDPKMVELSYYKDMPHLYSPVITNPREASKALQGVVGLMEKRYRKFAEAGVRNIESYNKKVSKSQKEFFLVVIIDELADLMLVASRDVEESIARLTQKARAVGIHVVLATQRPSVDVITGVIKANLPSRIAFQVLSKMDSRVIIDSNGADDLLGKGDMLFLGNGAAKPVRVQGAYLSEEEVQEVLAFIRSQGEPDYSKYKEEIVSRADDNTEKDEKNMEQFRKALELVLERKKVSYDLLRANGFSGPKATNVLSLMEIKGLIGKPGNSNRWEIYFDVINEFLEK